MSEAGSLDLVLAWHMHQPDYRDHATGEFTVPWVYLHAIKDYTDMAWHLERHPGMRAVVNLAPVLLDQIEDYSQQFATGTLRDPLLRLLVRDDAQPLTTAERDYALDNCFHANHLKMIAPFPAYKGLHDLYLSLEAHGRAALAYLSDQYIYDLLTWFHLSWTGEPLRRQNETIPRLMTMGSGFSRAHRLELSALIGECIAQIVPRFRVLGADGRVELSTTPHYHPLAPLLIDFGAVREALPDAPLPIAPTYPGGRESVSFHIRSALDSHARRFGAPATGMWPAEGAVSAAFLRMLGETGVTWVASSQSVLANSLRQHGGRALSQARDLYLPYRITAVSPSLLCFFRDERLSDLVGFEYAAWHGSDAAANFVQELERIAASAPLGERPTVSVILDGENAWEHYPYNGFYFLSELYGRLESHKRIRPQTFASCVAQRLHSAAEVRPKTGELPGITAGSWVYGNLSTWIGSAQKNHAWDLLASAKQSFDIVIGSGRFDAQRAAAARRQLADCEGSDWFWWFGDYNPAAAVESFDRLFRAKLSNLYRLLELPVPNALGSPISHGGGHPEAGGAMRRSSA